MTTKKTMKTEADLAHAALTAVEDAEQLMQRAQLQLRTAVRFLGRIEKDSDAVTLASGIRALIDNDTDDSFDGFETESNLKTLRENTNGLIEGLCDLTVSLDVGAWDDDDRTPTAPCPHCGKTMEIGDELPEERCCDGCAEALAEGQRRLHAKVSR